MNTAGYHYLEMNPNHAFNVDFMWSPALQWGLWFVSLADLLPFASTAPKELVVRVRKLLPSQYKGSFAYKEKT